MPLLIFGYPFAVIVALILLSVLAVKFLNKKRTSVDRKAEDADASAPDLSTETDSEDADASPPDLSTESNSEDADASAPDLSTETNLGASSSSTTPTEINNSASTSSTGDRYEVFLNFSGRDVRTNFISHLYNGLTDIGVRTFKDDKELRQGRKFGPDLLAAIKNSKILMPVLSINYGRSKWCLDELAQMMECSKNNTREHIVLPIFFKVEPSDVRYQIGSFKEAFQKHETRYDQTILKKWRRALTEVSDLEGWHATGDEGELVKSVVQRVWSELTERFNLDIPKNLVGINSHAERVVKFVDDNPHTTLFVGIHGMAGVGKTTLAKTIFNMLFSQFEYHSFLADIREAKTRHGIEHLQKQLIRDILKQDHQVPNKDIGTRFLSSMCKGKKVLILLDDADHDDQLKALAGNHNWFSPGSIILITSRDKRVLDNAGVDRCYEHLELDQDQSLLLFSRHAFPKGSPPSEFKNLAYQVVSTTGGLPLSLKVLGSFLSGKKQDVWISTFEKFKTVPYEEVQAKLKISYEALDRRQKQIFLDIACFFIGADERTASYMWEACKFSPKLELDKLKSLSLITIGDNHELRMHDQLRDLGREIVRETGQWKPWDYSRLWDCEDILRVFEGNKGTDKIDAIYLSKGRLEGPGETANQDGDSYTDKHFRNLKSLRFLYVRGAHFKGDFQDAFGELKWLTWQNCPSTFEASNFNVKELVVLDLSRSKISDEWKGWDFIMMAKELKFLDLTSCECLRMVSISAFKNLEILILRDCQNLEKIDSSFRDMKLTFIDLTRCESLRNTDFLSTCKNLKHLILRGCEEVEQIDPSIGDMKSLVLLDLTGCKSLKKLPAGVGKLEALEQLFLKDCRHISELPDIEALQNLKILNICRTTIRELPNGIGRLRKLQELDASLCKQLQEETPKSFSNLSCLQRLDFHGCEKLQWLPDLPSSLISLSVTCRSRKLPSFSHLNHLKELRLYDCRFLECLLPIDGEASGLTKSPTSPFKLEILEIYGCESMRTVDVSQFNHLRILSVQRCDIEVQGLDKLKHVKVTPQNPRV